MCGLTLGPTSDPPFPPRWVDQTQLSLSCPSPVTTVARRCSWTCAAPGPCALWKVLSPPPESFSLFAYRRHLEILSPLCFRCSMLHPPGVGGWWWRCFLAGASLGGGVGVWGSFCLLFFFFFFLVVGVLFFCFGFFLLEARRSIFSFRKRHSHPTELFSSPEQTHQNNITLSPSDFSYRAIEAKFL